MAEVRALNGIRYSPRFVNELADVICPPYDIISPQLQGELYGYSPYNFVRVEYGQESAADSSSDNRYTRAAATLDNWLKTGVMTADASPSIYLHDHYFRHGGRQFKRRGIIARVRLEEWHRMVVRPHEGTLSGPKSDRINLLRALRANTSPVLSMYQDSGGAVARILAKAENGSPAAQSRPLDGEWHELRAITDAHEIALITAALADVPLYIADGHHRYESAMVYKREQEAVHPGDAEAPFNFVMMTLVAFDDPGLLILPPHRLLRGLSAARLEDIKRELPAFFDVKKLPQDGAAWRRLDEWQREAGKERLAVYGLDGDNFWLLTLRDFEAAARFMPGFHTEIYKRMDVSLVDHIILEKILGIQPDGHTGIAFNYDREDSVKKVKAGEYQLAFIIKPVVPETIKDISDAQDRMPRKSTYFYPKLPSGLVVNRLI